MSKYTPQTSEEFDYQAVAEAIVRMAPVYRAPFISVIGYSEAMLEGLSGKLTDTQVADVEAIRVSGWQALSQINDILDVMQIMSGEMDYEREALDVGQLLNDVARDFNRSRLGDASALKTEAAPDLPQVEGDQARLRQVLLGLIHAALPDDYSQTTIHVGATRHEEGVLLEVRDQCQVANADDLTYFFEPGWVSRLTNNHWRRMQWQSYLAHHFVNAQGGRIWVEAAPAKGELPAGTRVLFTLPAAKQA
jgi:hypothetical protein